MKAGTYLARFGRTYGPYSEPELTRLQAEGQELKDYSWIWDPQSSAWKPLESCARAAFSGYERGSNRGRRGDAHRDCRRNHSTTGRTT